jgi:hypothetical protein
VAARDDGYQAYDARNPAAEGPGPIGYAALVAAWLAPGLGHWQIGEKARGVVLGLTVYLLFAGGLLLGGIRAINPADQPIWTYTQFLTGWPMLICNSLEHGTRAELGDPNASDAASREGSLVSEANELLRDTPGNQRQAVATKFLAEHPLLVYHPKVQDMGSVYCGIAGMLNLLVIFDVLLRNTGSIRVDQERARRERLAALHGDENAGGAGAAPGGAT